MTARNIAARILGGQHELDFASSGPDALELLNINPPDLMLLDLLMPGMSGFDVLEQIRSRNIQVPVFVLSAVTAQLRSSLGLGDVSVSLNLKPLELATKRALHLGLALAELFTNAVKYGGADGSELSIVLESTSPDRARLSVEDRGPGLPTGFDPSRADSLGIRLTGILAEQLGGTLSFHAAEPRGIRAELEFGT